MKNGLSFWLLGLLLAVCVGNAKAKTGLTHLSATVIRVQKRDCESFFGSNPTDAPFRSEVYLYDIWLKANCATYVVLFESSADQPPPMFAPESQVDVRAAKHVLSVSTPWGGDAKLSIVKQGIDSAAPCAAR